MGKKKNYLSKAKWSKKDCLTTTQIIKALKLLESSNKEGILPVIDETFEVPLEKHPKASTASNDILIEEEV